MTGGSGRDILLGGLGVDVLRGGGGDDILVGDRYHFEDRLDQVFALLSEWSRSDPGSTPATRRNHLLTGGGLNDTSVLNATTIDPDVRGSVTVRLENVPWDQALEMILRVNGLGYVLEGNIVRVGAPPKL